MVATMRTIRMIVAYDGTDLAGYQRQSADKGLTVQGCLEAALSIVCNEPITVYGASRTDAGVHARGQVVAFTTTGRIPAKNLTRALIAHMPSCIVVRHAEEMPSDWKPRGSVVGKRYTYTIHNDAVVDPMKSRYAYHVKKDLHIEAMREAAQHLLGTHDFTTFKGANTTPVDPVKTIYAIGIARMGDTVQITVIGSGFVYHMVRNIAGLLIDVGLGKRKAGDVPAYLVAKDRKVIGKTAPAYGLCLEKVYFCTEDMEKSIEDIKEQTGIH